MPGTAKPKILVAEDSQALAKVIALKLSPHFEVDLALDGEEALARLQRTRTYSAVVLDLIMPRTDGMEVLRNLREKGDKIPVVVVTARPVHEVEGELRLLAVEALLPKPLDYAALIEQVRRSVRNAEKESAGAEWVERDTGRKYPFRGLRRFCYICGFDAVRTFAPIPGACEEDWSAGPFPVYTSRNGYADWDFLKTLVTVCPYCFFASAAPDDFAERVGDPYPYSEDSKKIMARAISHRKKLVPEGVDIDRRFDFPDRSKDEVISSLILAEKCCNGLVLAGKPGAYVQAALYSAILGAIHHPKGERFYRQALMSCQNQLKDKGSPRLTLVKTYYFCIVLYMLTGTTVLGRDIMKKVETMYADHRLEDVGEEERRWLLRINHIWRAGVDMKRGRDIHKYGLAH